MHRGKPGRRWHSQEHTTSENTPGNTAILPIVAVLYASGVGACLKAVVAWYGGRQHEKQAGVEATGHARSLAGVVRNAKPGDCRSV